MCVVVCIIGFVAVNIDDDDNVDDDGVYGIVFEMGGK